MKNRRPGFTLIELLVSLTIMAILLAGAPNIVEQLRGTRMRRANADAAQLAIAIWGPTRDYHGLVGDIGFPAGSDPSSIVTDGIGNDLVYPVSGSTFSGRQNALGVTSGWYGPYAGFDPKALQVDPWGNNWNITAAGQVVSKGPDGQAGTADDIASPVAGPMMKGTTSTITISVRDAEGGLLDQTQVNVFVWGPDGTSTPRGTLVRTAAVWDASAYAFKATGVTPGRHAIEAMGVNSATIRCDGFAIGSCVGLYGHATASVVGGAVAAVEVRARTMETSL
jgi:prepilin-type N-terminal cleavage/methylation domain-containing protein